MRHFIKYIDKISRWTAGGYRAFEQATITFQSSYFPASRCEIIDKIIKWLLAKSIPECCYRNSIVFVVFYGSFNFIIEQK